MGTRYSLKELAKTSLNPDSRIYNALAWSYGWIARKPFVRRAAYMRWRKDSCFDSSELWMASACPATLLDAVLERYRPHSFLDVGCGTGRAVEYLHGKGLDCVGLEGSAAAVAASPVPLLIRHVNLNVPIALGRKFDVVWSYEVAEHIHPAHTDTFLATLIRHGDRIVMSAARPGQGGAGHFNEQPPGYWIAKMAARGYGYDAKFSEELHRMPEDHSRNVMVFLSTHQ